jgi:hypothetical protein
MSARKSRKLRLGWYFIGCALFVFSGILAVKYTSGDDRVMPENRDVFLWRPEVKDKFVLQVNASDPPPSHEPLDILFLFDTTASMSNVIRAVRDAARANMSALRRISSNAKFAVASFGDYPLYDDLHGYPWRLDQDFSSESALIQRALDGLQVVDGGDIPEAYSRALFESQFLSWRPDARRFVILFGDAPAHDANFYGRNFGVDPGRDGIPGTPDDLRLMDVVEQLARKQITIIPVYDTTRGPTKALLSDAIRGFAMMAKETGGLTMPVGSASDIPEAIAAGVREAYRPIPIILIPQKFSAWVNVSDARKMSSTHAKFSFDVSLLPPAGTDDGVYRFPLTAVYPSAGGGGVIGQTDVTIRLGLVNYPWRRLLFSLYGFFLVALFGAKLIFSYRQKICRYEHNGQYRAVMWRILVAAFVFLIVYNLRAQGDDALIKWNLFGRFPSTFNSRNQLQQPRLYPKGS